MLILILVAFISGILSALSPCVFPILPVVLGSGIDGKKSRIKGVILGIIFSFTFFILAVSFLISLLPFSSDTFRMFSVSVLFLFGFFLAFPYVWNKIQFFLETKLRFHPKLKGEGFLGGIILGAALGAVWTPCIGPIVASVATLAAVNSFSFYSVALVFAYAFGAGTALYLLAIGSRKLSSHIEFVKKNNMLIKRIFGIIIILTAFFIYTGIDRKLQIWTLDILPEEWTQSAEKFEKKFNNIINKLGFMDFNIKNTNENFMNGDTVVRDTALQTDFTGAKVNPRDLQQGCFSGKDCIPSLDNPIFEKTLDAVWMKDEDRVFAVDFMGIKRAYPQRILNWHEIVNDEFNGVPVAVTFCPLCGSAVGFERKVNGIITEFGVSGKLHNSDLVMYDRFEGNLWQQITGGAIVGPAARRNEILKQIPIITMDWKEWKEKFPDSRVLSINTGFLRDYAKYPYGTYENDDNLYFGIKNENRTLQIKTVVYGIEVNGRPKAYPKNIFDEENIISDNVGGNFIRIKKKDNGEITAVNLDTSEEIIPLRLFWFAWVSFHPDTELYKR